jgi:hypothetical protein
MRSSLKGVGVMLPILLQSCTPVDGTELLLRSRPTFIDLEGQAAQLTLTATDSQGNPGSGEVRFRSAIGSLATPVTQLLVNGEATVTFSCDAAVDPTCVPGRASIIGEWVSKNTLFQAFAGVTLLAPVVVTPDAGSPDAGSPDAGPSDAGSTDAGAPDAGADGG